MDIIKAELDSEDETHPSGIEPQFVDMKQQDMAEPYIVIDKFEAEVGQILYIREGFIIFKCKKCLSIQLFVFECIVMEI